MELKDLVRVMTKKSSNQQSTKILNSLKDLSIFLNMMMLRG